MSNCTGLGEKRAYVLLVHPRTHPHDKPIATIWVERLESLRHSDRRLTIEYSLIQSDTRDLKSGTFSAEYRASAHSVSLTCGAVFLDLPGYEGQRIGTFLMHEIVTWAQQWPNAVIESVTLIDAQARGNAERIRRNRLYENIGLVFDYDTENQLSGRSRLITVSQLISVETWRKNIELIEPVAHLVYQSEQSRAATMEIERLSRALNSALDREKSAVNSPVLWALKQHLGKSTVQQCLVVAVFVVFLMMYLY